MSFVNAMKVIGDNSSHIIRTIQSLLVNNSIPFELDKEQMLVFPSQKVLDLEELLKLSSRYSDDYIFWSWVNSVTGVQGFVRLLNGKIVRKKVKTVRL